MESGVIETETGGDIASVTIKGSMIGGPGAGSARIQSNGGGDIGPVKIGTLAAPGILIGGPGVDSGRINTDDGGSIASVTIFGNLNGAAGSNSGSIQVSDSGSIGPIRILGSVTGGGGNSSGAILTQDNGSIASVQIRGDLIGGGGVDSGSIQTNDVGNIGPVQIGGRLLGGAGSNSGSIQSPEGGIQSVVLGNSVIGGSGNSSGTISAALNIGTVRLTGGGELLGGTGVSTGSIISKNGDIGNVSIDGRVLGASGSTIYSGVIQASHGTVKNVHIGLDLVGGSTGVGQAAFMTGAILGENIGTVRIDGSIVAGTNAGTGIVGSGAVMASHHLQALSVGENLSGQASNPVKITAGGVVKHGPSGALAIDSVRVGGNCTRVDILAGFSQIGDKVSPDAQIGSVVVNGLWTAGNIAAGVERTDAYYGNLGDKSINLAGVDSSVIARIGKIIIRGGVNGTAFAGDSFGFVSEHIQRVVIEGVPIALTAGPRNDLAPIFAGAATNDVKILEVN